MTMENSAAAVPSLYDTLGGVYAIATVIDDLVDRLVDDPRLNANPLVDEAHHRAPKPGLKYLVTEMLCWAAGGPQRYTGRTMAESHEHLAIADGEWQAFMDDVRLSLDKFQVPEAAQSQIRAILESTKGDIVVPKTT
jgi:hemoglobin